VVKFGEIKRGKREIFVYPTGASGEILQAEVAQLYEVPAGKHLRVHEGDKVRAGDRLTEGRSTRTTFSGSRVRARCRSTSSTRCRRCTASRACGSPTSTSA